MSHEKILKNALSAYTISNRVLNVLRNPNISKIGFDLNGLCVTGVRYSVVAEAIYQGKITCEVVGQFTLQPGETLKPGTSVAALYKPPANTMFFPRENFGEANAYEQAVILHEATHAMFDLYAKTNDDRVLMIDDESAAVLAQALYFRLCNADANAVRRFRYIGNGPGDLALNLADRMIAERGGFEKDKRTYFLRPEQTASLRDAVAWQWDLIKKYDGAGYGTDSSGTLSIYDGVVNCFSCLARQK